MQEVIGSTPIFSTLRIMRMRSLKYLHKQDCKIVKNHVNILFMNTIQLKYGLRAFLYRKARWRKESN